jgi:hypothetical protein
VMITGSKFAAGPPFAGAILLPPEIVEQLRSPGLPPGLLAYTAAEDWPVALRRKIRCQFAVTDNVGAGLRWEAALAELERLLALPVQFRKAVTRAFANAIERRVLDDPRFELVDQGLADGLASDRTIFPILTVAQDNTPLASEAIHQSLRLPLPGNSDPGRSNRTFHVGQSVPIGRHSALRVCLSAHHILDAAENMAKGPAFETSVAPLMADLDGLFLKWACVADDIGRRSRSRFSS